MFKCFSNEAMLPTLKLVLQEAGRDDHKHEADEGSDHRQPPSKMRDRVTRSDPDEHPDPLSYESTPFKKSSEKSGDT